MLQFEQFAIDVAQFRWFSPRQWQPLLSDISFSINPGELIALVGSSGEGKSLLLQSALGLLPNNMRCRGDIRLNGQTLSEKAKQKYRGNTLCYIPQGVSSLNPLIKIGPQLQRTAKLSGIYRHSHEVMHHLQRYNLQADLVKRFPNQLSGGMAKRVLTCSATLTEAQYILADEVTSWLDDTHACQLLTNLKQLTQQGRGILWVTHDLAMAARFADRIAVLRNGSLQEVVQTSQLKQRQTSPWLLSLWDALPEQSFNSRTTQ